MATTIKKPVGGAYGVFMNEKREEFKKQAEAAGDKAFGAVAKLASAAWKAMGDAEKAPYEQKYKTAKEKFDEFKASDDYVAPEKKMKRGKKFGKVAKDKDAPKRPAGGAYGIFMNEKRDEFQKQAKAAGDTSFAGPTKLGSAAWKAVGEEEKASYEKKYQAAKAKYEEEFATYKASKPQLAEAEPTPEKVKKSAPKASPEEKKAGVKRTAKVAAAPRKAAKVAAAVAGVALDAAVLKEAEGLGLRGALENFAKRKEMVDGSFDGAKMLRALKASGGLVNKAKTALLGA